MDGISAPRVRYTHLYTKAYKKEYRMRPLRVDQDIRPLSEFRAAVAAFVKQVTESRRPLVLTQHGRGVAVLLDAHEFEEMRERLELLEDLYLADEQLAAGRGVSHDEAKARLLKSLEK